MAAPEPTEADKQAAAAIVYHYYPAVEIDGEHSYYSRERAAQIIAEAMQPEREARRE